MPRKIADLIKAKGGATKYRLHGVGVQVCCCVFINMYLSNTMFLVHIRMYLIFIHKCCQFINIDMINKN